MAKKKKKLVSGYFDANTGTRITDSHIEENDSGWRIVKNEPTLKQNSNSVSKITNSHLQRYNLDGSNKLTNSISNKLNNMATKKYNSKLFKQDLEDTLNKQNKIQNYTSITGQTPKITENTSEKEKFLIKATNERLQKEAEEKKQQEAYNKLPFNQKLNLARKSMGKSALNATTEIGKGVIDFAEGLLDAGVQFGSSKYNPVMWARTGQTPWSKDQNKLNSYQNIAKEIVEKDASQSFIDNQLGYNKKLSNGKTIQETLDNGAIINSKNFGGKLFRNIGAQLPGYMTGSEAGSLTTMGISSFGSGTEEAYKKGATRGQATGYGLLNSAIEVATEKAFAGVGGVYGSGEIDQAIINGINKNIKNKLGQKLVKFGVSATGEGLEELLGDFAQPLAQKLTYASKEDLGKLYSDQNYLEDFVSGALSAMIMQGTTMPMQNAQQTQMVDAIQTRVTNNNATQIFNEIKQQNKDLMDYEVANIVNTALENKGLETVDFQETTQENEINNQQENEIDTPQEVKQEVQQEIKEEVQEQPTIPVEKMNEILNDVVKKSDVEFTKEEISELRESMYKQVEKLGAKVEENIESKQEIKEQNNNNLKLEQRVSGDKLLNAQDLIDEVKSVGAKVDDNGYITLYHQTTPEAAQKIKETGKMISKEKDIFFSTSKDAQQSNGRGNEKLEFKIPAENLVLDDLFSDNADLKISLDGKNELDVSNYIVDNSLDNSIKQKQLDIIKDSNPMQDDYHTGIRTIEDIKTLEETLNDSDYEGYDEFNPDLTRQDIENAIKKGTIMVYSSYPIENGVFVSPSKMEAESYSGNGKVYSKEVSINDVAWIDPTQGQYAKVQNDTLNFKQTKGNIPINEKLLNKYNNVKEMMNSEINNYDGKVDVKDINQINELKDVDLSTLNKTDVFNLAKNIFDRYNNKNLFNNNGNEIMVSHADIKESIKHIYNENQIKYLKEHLQVFSDLGDIIESATLSSQGLENKKNMQSTHSHNNIWSYYLNGLKINGETYLLEFDVVSRDNGENHYRVQRIQKTDTSAGNTVNNSITPTLEASASINNDTTKPNKSQIAPSQNSMQQNEKNTPKEKNTIEERIPDVIEVRQSPMDKTSLNKLSKNMAKELYLNNSQTTDLKDVIQDFYRRDFNEYSKKDLFNSIKEKFSEHNEKIIADDSLNDIQQQIRNTKIKVPEQIKEGIGDYNNLRQSNFGKTKLGNTGIELDSFYDELASDYPAYFDSELTGEDQLLRIIDVANMDNSYTETYKLDDNYIQDITDYIDESIKDYKNEELRKLADKDIKEKYKQDKITYALPKKITHKEVRQQLLNEMGITDKDLSVGKDIAKFRGYQLTDPIRVNEKVFGAEMGKLINEATIEKTKHNTAEKTRFLNRERNDIKDLGIKARSKESAAVQKYAEKQYVNKYGETVPYGDKELMAEFKDAKTQEKIKRAASMLRNKYDKYIDEINDVITALGYDPIPKRKDYMKHFQELGDVFSKTGVPFNLNDMKAEDLPTDLNGLTEFNKPGKNWFASAQKRYGNKTTYDAITGIDTYLEGAANLIYHTADIQRYRALSELIRDTFGQKKGYENLDNLTDKEAQQRIKDIQNNKLSNYAAWLDERANSLAGKKGAVDRAPERMASRRIYTGLNWIKKQVGSNMTGFNVRSAMTNFISSTIASSKTNKIAFTKGTISAINNLFKRDGFVNKSDFLTSRFGSKQLSSKFWQKLSNAGQVFMEGSDYFTANQIVRSKYYEGLQKGMTEQEAIDYADDFASRVMGDRSQGMLPEFFDSKTLGFLTQFQLETNNQWQYMIHDSIMDYQKNSKINGGLKAGATILFQMGQLAAFSYFFNELFEKLTGSRAAFDPIDIIKKLLGADDDDKDKSFEERLQSANSELIDSLPFTSLIGSGGRLPVSEAITPIFTFLDYASGKKNKYGQKIKLSNVKDDALESIPYYFLPAGYGQIKKTAKGLSMFTNDKEIKGSYTKSGRLRFPVEDTPENKIQAALFGQYASKTAREYVNGGHSTLTENQQKELKVLDIPISDYWEIKSGLSDISNKLKGSNKTTDERKEIYYKYIDSLKINKDKKNLLKKLQYKSYTESDEDIKDYISSIKAKKTTKKDLLKKMGLDD